jgi:hypothetical protein
MVQLGSELMVTVAVVSAPTQPSADVTKFEYVPAPAHVGTVMPVLEVFVVKLKLLGPFTRYVNGPFPPAVAVKFVAAAPAHTIVPVSPAVGSGLTVTVAVANWLTQLLALVTRFE